MKKTTPNMPRRPLRRAGFVLLMLAGVVGFAEALGAIFYYTAFPEPRRKAVEAALGLGASDFNNVLRYRPHPYLNYIGNPDYLTADGRRLHDPIGIRATDVDLRHKRDGVIRIVAIGASTTFGLYVGDASEAWPALLGTALREAFGSRIEVINAGVPNYTTYEMLGFATLWLPELQPDIVLIHTGLNDAFTVGYPDEGGPDNTTFRHSWTYRPLAPTLRISMRMSLFLRVLASGWLARSGHAVGDLNTVMQFPPPGSEAVLENASVATGKYFRRNLEALIVLIRHAGAKPVLVNMPINPKFEETGVPYYQTASEAVLRNNRIMDEVGAREQVPVVDLYSRIREPEIFIDAVHVGRGGMIDKARLVLQVVGPMVEEQIGGKEGDP